MGEYERGTGKRALLISPFLFAVYPILFLYAQNLDEVSPSDLLKPIGIVLVATVLLLLVSRRILGSREKGALAVSLCLFAIFTYGHVIEPLRGKALAGFVIGRSWFILPIWCFLLLFALVLVARVRGRLYDANRFFNYLGAVLVAVPLVQSCFYQVSPVRSAAEVWKDFAQKSAERNSLRRPNHRTLPDIYYIILDEYARHDVLRSYFGYDNSDFVNYLKDKGFYVASKSASNYTSTYPSLSSSLNFDYLHALAEAGGAERVDDRLLANMIQHARAILELKNAGYKFVFFPSGFHVTNRNPNADIVFTGSRIRMTEFDRVLFDTTVFKPIINAGTGNYRRNILATFEKLGRIPDIKEPTFTFAHITLPHQPYLFDAAGNELPVPRIPKKALTKSEYTKLYTGQLAYANKRMKPIIEQIITRSDVPPVIILQGDHGIVREVEGVGEPSPLLKRCILNAYYLPNGGGKLLYPSISPVNTFRVVINYYLAGDYDLLPDVTFLCEETDRGIKFKRLAPK